jgi:hypothetical protein
MLLNLLVFESIESSSDFTCQPLHTIPLLSCRCHPQLLNVSHASAAASIQKATVSGFRYLTTRAGPRDELQLRAGGSCQLRAAEVSCSVG